jgi:hypothetical protein
VVRERNVYFSSQPMHEEEEEKNEEDLAENFGRRELMS